MSSVAAHPAVPASRLRTAAFARIGEEGRTEIVEARLMQAISAGALIEGERLPSESELSDLFGVAVLTVREALSTLRHRGLIETRRGRHGGSFVRTSPGAVEAVNAQLLKSMPRVALADLGLHYEVISSACAEYACQRATPDEVAAADRFLARIADLPRESWRRGITDVQLELASLSQSVRLTTDHVRLQTEFTPLLALQDGDADSRKATHDALTGQIDAIRRRDIDAARQVVRDSVRASIRSLVTLKANL